MADQLQDFTAEQASLLFQQALDTQRNAVANNPHPQLLPVLSKVFGGIIATAQKGEQQLDVLDDNSPLAQHLRLALRLRGYRVDYEPHRKVSTIRW